ncbi:MAG: ribbon-helix-helix protein, CopG family [Rubrivivax sp.]|jgi:hypothetical protein|nr:ribbon-helix-helix protein, CopG family [Rubrivivax sp.]
MRITARLDPETDEQLNYLVAATGHTVSHVLRDSVAAQYRIVRSQRARGPQRLLARVGQGDSGRSDIASDTKAALAEALDIKLGRPVTGPAGGVAARRGRADR